MRINEEKKQLHATLVTLKREKSPRYKADRADRYRLRKRAKAVGLKTLGRGKPTEANRKKWLKELLRLEKIQKEKLKEVSIK